MSGRHSRRRTATRSDDSAVVQVVSFGLIAAALIIFLAVFNATWVPVWVLNLESDHSDELREAMTDWADTAEDFVARGTTDRSFSRVLPVGTEGLPILSAGASGGTVNVQSAATLEIYDATGGTPDYTASGSLSATTDPTRFPAQTFRYALGVLEVDQNEGAWVDLRNLVSAERAASDKIELNIQAVSITGAPQSSGTNTQVSVSGTLTGSTDATGAATNYVRLKATNVEAAAWRAAIGREFGAKTLDKDADGLGCTTTTEDYCFDAATNTATTVDVYVRNVKVGWTVTVGTVDAEVRA